jgi:uncharacterized membrane-anchored protein
LGIAAIDVTRWFEKPNYDSRSHRLIRSAELRTKGRNDGKRYKDFNPSTSKVAAYGLATLVASERH